MPLVSYFISPAGKIKDAGIARVSISIDGIDAEGHDSFRGVKGAFEGALNGARLLREAGVEFQINTTITKRKRLLLSSHSSILSYRNPVKK